jgi:hypothetical protein
MSSDLAKVRAMAWRGRGVDSEEEEDERAGEERGRTPAKERVDAASYVPFRSERCQGARSHASPWTESAGSAVQGKGSPFFHERPRPNLGARL